MHEAPPQGSALLVTPAGFVDADTALAADVIVWDDAVAARAFLPSQNTSTQRPGRHDTAA